MFDKKEPEKNIKQADTIIGQSVRVKGNFHGQGNFIVEGIVEGSVKTTNYLLVGQKAEISANIEAKDSIISGKIKGNIKIQNYLEIKSGASINGDIKAKEISIEKGAKLNGNVVMANQENEKSNK